MASRIDNTKINANFPIAGQNNDSQGFRDNFGNIKVALGHAQSEISEIQSKAIFKSALTGTTSSNDMEWGTLYRTQLRAYSETVFDHGLKTGVVGLSYGNGSFHKISMTNNVILQFSGWPPAGQAGRMVIWLSIANADHRAFFPDSLTYGLNNRQLDGRSLKFPAAGDYLIEIATIDGGNSLWFVDFANLNGGGTGNGETGATGATGLGLPGFAGFTAASKPTPTGGTSAIAPTATRPLLSGVPFKPLQRYTLAKPADTKPAPVPSKFVNGP